MNDELRQKLCELIVEYGRSLCNDPRRCEGLLKDYYGGAYYYGGKSSAHQVRLVRAGQ